MATIDMDSPLSPLTPNSTTTYPSSESESIADSSHASIGRSQRYKVAMTARARHRRMRRIQKPDDEIVDPVVTPDGSPPSRPLRSRYERSLKKKSGEMRRDAPELDDGSTFRKEFLPDLTGGVSEEEVRDAANFTSIQFQCSNLSGEVEMFSGDELSALENNSPGNESVLTAGGEEYFQNEVWSEATTPSILQRGEIFHHKAAAEIVGLLTPDRMFRAGLMAPEVVTKEGSEDDCPPDVNGDSPTGVAGPVGGLTFKEDGPASRCGEWRGVEPVVQRELFKGIAVGEGKNGEEVVRRALETRLIAPSQQLEELLSQIKRNVKTVPDIGRAYATRRKNACGALKILSAKEENRLKICWTSGVLEAISSILNDVSAKTTDELAFNANTEGRNRIVSTLLNLSVNKKNRMLMCTTPGVLEAIANAIGGDDGESRQGCCTVLLYLAKTSETRPLIIACPGLLSALSEVIKVTPYVSPSDTCSPKISYQNPFFKQFRSPSTTTTVSPGSPEMTIKTPPNQDENTSRTDDDDSSSVSDGCSSSGSQSMSTEDNRSADSVSAGHPDNGNVMENVAPPKGRNTPAEKKLKMEISFKTPTVAEEDTEQKDDGVDYDADPNRFLHGARLSVFACLLCLVKNKENAFDIARVEDIVNSLIGVSNKHSSPSHPRAIAIIAHLTRHPKNCHQLVFKHLTLLPTLQVATSSEDPEARKYALCAIQNLSMDRSCRAPIAHTHNMIASITERCNSENKEEVLAAVASLQNLSDEPANLIQFTIVKNCIGTVISIAQSDEGRRMDGMGTDLTQFMAKNTLATISYWFRKIASSGSQRIRDPAEESPASGSSAPLYSAMLEPTVHNQWS